jgi:hypothetical protein
LTGWFDLLKADVQAQTVELILCDVVAIPNPVHRDLPEILWFSNGEVSGR